MSRFLFLTAVLASCSGCTSAMPPSPISSTLVDVLPYLVGDRETWPRYGSQWQHQIADLLDQQVCWTKYGNPEMFECWRWDDQWVYHVIDHGLDGGRGGSYRFTDARWMPRRIPASGWSLDLPTNRVRRFDAMCREDPSRAEAFPYRVRAWHEPQLDIGGDLGVRDVIVLEYQTYQLLEDSSGLAERFYLARGAGWYLWTRADGVRVAFTRRGGPAVSAIRTACVW